MYKYEYYHLLLLFYSFNIITWVGCPTHINTDI